MPELDPMEAALARLMPRGLSDEGLKSIEAMLDELAGPAEENAEASPEKGRLWKFIVPAGIAAGLAGLAALLPREPAGTKEFATIPARAELVLVGERDRIEQVTDEGWISDPDGATMQAVRVRVVEENTLRDKETGIVVQVSEPREELVLFPVSAF